MDCVAQDKRSNSEGVGINFCDHMTPGQSRCRAKITPGCYTKYQITTTAPDAGTRSNFHIAINLVFWRLDLRKTGAGDIEKAATIMAIANISQVPTISPASIQSEQWIQLLLIIMFFITLFIFYALLILHGLELSHIRQNQIRIQEDSESDLSVRSMRSEISDLERQEPIAPPRTYKQVITEIEIAGSGGHSSCPRGNIICVICLEAMADSDIVRRLSCGHVFHSDCITHWYLRQHYTCPLCVSRYIPAERANIRTDS
ncbi:hypothetical protein DER44DRAFT_795493 [Fusarium oxysporum]|nr:hypothetical protein DER44DRAFT_795493 [Fusarium oxysporum]